MKKWFQENIDSSKFKKSIFSTILLLVLILFIVNMGITYSRYETNTTIDLSPKIAFFITDVGTESGTLKLEDIIPNKDPYTYAFTVSNFKDSKKANVDLTYSITITTTTNLPLEYQIYKEDGTVNEIDQDTFTTNEDGMYFRNLIIDDVNTFSYKEKQTDTYILSVDFGEQYKNSPDEYESVVELVEITINAEQVV